MPTLKDLNGYHYRDAESRDIVISYIFQPNKTPGRFIGCIGVDPQNISNSMCETAASYKKDSGVRLRHMVLAFSPSELADPSVAYRIGCDVMAHIHSEYQAAFAVHQDTPNLHIHFVFNSVSYTDCAARYKNCRWTP